MSSSLWRPAAQYLSTYPSAEAAQLPVPYTGVIGAAARAAAAANQKQRIGVIGTAATIRSGSYRHPARKIVV
ncbi:glutamate racemase, partial [human gut metagenome]